MNNWTIWLLAAGIIFLLSILGYLSESKKKNEKKEEELEPEEKKEMLVEPEIKEEKKEPEIKEETNDNWNVMPEVNVQTVAANAVSNTNLDSTVFSKQQVTEPASTAPAETSSVFADANASSPEPIPANPKETVKATPLPQGDNSNNNIETL